MNGQQIVDSCREQARRQFRDHAMSAMECEIELLRTKVLELSKRNAQLHADMREQDREFRREAQDIATEARWQARNDADDVPHGSY